MWELAILLVEIAATNASIISGGVSGLTPPPADRIKPRPAVFSMHVGPRP